MRKSELIPAFRKEYVVQQLFILVGRAEIYLSSCRLTYLSRPSRSVLQVDTHTWKVSPHLWRSSRLVTNDSSDCSTSGVGFGVVWKSVLALTRQYKLLRYFRGNGGEFKMQSFHYHCLENARCVLAVGSYQLLHFNICHFAVYVMLFQTILFCILIKVTNSSVKRFDISGK